MRTRLQVLVIVALAFAALPVLGHRSSRDLPDEQVYEKISILVSSASEADMDSQKMPEGGVMTTVNVPCVRRLEDLITGGLIDYASRLDGSVDITIEFNDRGVKLVITQK